MDAQPKPPRVMKRPRKSVLYADIARLTEENARLRDELAVALQPPTITLVPYPIAASLDEAMARADEYPPGTVWEIREPAGPTPWQRICNVWRRLLLRRE